MIKRLIFSLCIFAFGGHLAAQLNDDLSKMGSSLFETIRVNNYAQIENQLPTIDDMDEFLEQVINYYPPEKQREMIAKRNEDHKSELKSIYDSFESVHQKGISSGINWTKAKFTNVIAVYCGENPIPKDKVTCLLISFTYLGVKYSIETAAVKVNRGYVLCQGFKLY